MKPSNGGSISEPILGIHKDVACYWIHSKEPFDTFDIKDGSKRYYIERRSFLDKIKVYEV